MPAIRSKTLEQRARRLIAAQNQLSFLCGALLYLPMLIPGLGQALQLLGFVGGASALTRMHLYLILEIALLYRETLTTRPASRKWWPWSWPPAWPRGLLWGLRR